MVVVSSNPAAGTAGLLATCTTGSKTLAAAKGYAKSDERQRSTLGRKESSTSSAAAPSSWVQVIQDPEVAAPSARGKTSFSSSNLPRDSPLSRHAILEFPGFPGQTQDEEGRPEDVLRAASVCKRERRAFVLAAKQTVQSSLLHLAPYLLPKPAASNPGQESQQPRSTNTNIALSDESESEGAFVDQAGAVEAASEAVIRSFEDFLVTDLNLPELASTPPNVQAAEKEEEDREEKEVAALLEEAKSKEKEAKSLREKIAASEKENERRARVGRAPSRTEEASLSKLRTRLSKLNKEIGQTQQSAAVKARACTARAEAYRHVAANGSVTHGSGSGKNGSGSERDERDESRRGDDRAVTLTQGKDDKDQLRFSLFEEAFLALGLNLVRSVGNSFLRAAERAECACGGETTSSLQGACRQTLHVLADTRLSFRDGLRRRGCRRANPTPRKIPQK